MNRMKKIICAVLICVIAIAAAGCGAKTKTATCTIEQDGMQIKSVYEASGDVVKKITQTTTIQLDEYSEDQIAAIEGGIDQAKEQYDAIKGTKYSMEKTDTAMIEVIVIDANEDTIKELSDKSLLPVEGDVYKISLAKTLENLKGKGWTVEE